MNENYIIANYYNKMIEVYCGPGVENYVGVVKRINDKFLLLEIDGKEININLGKIISFREVL